MIAEFIEAGHEVFDLGGGVGGSGDPLFRFKAGFSVVVPTIIHTG
ncbi:MAG: hypothetical protein Q8J63_00960 [Candidatus Aquicultor sp.]|nr:hypothetical protein [Candidatus Aquicultor sp.]